MNTLETLRKLGAAASEIERLRAAARHQEAALLRKHAEMVRQLGSSMSPGALAAAMERRADALEAARCGEKQ